MPNTQLPPLLQLFVCFPEFGVFHGLSSSLIFPHSVSLHSLIVPSAWSFKGQQVGWERRKRIALLLERRQANIERGNSNLKNACGIQ